MLLQGSQGCPCKRWRLVETLRSGVIDQNPAQKRLDSRLDATKAVLALVCAGC